MYTKGNSQLWDIRLISEKKLAKSKSFHFLIPEMEASTMYFEHQSVSNLTISSADRDS